MAEYNVLSNFGVRYFLMDLQEGAAAAASAVSGSILVTADNKLITAAQSLLDTKEITDVLSCNPGTIDKDMKKFRTLNGDGWESAVALGQSISEGSMDLIRTGQGNAYTGLSGATATYNRLRDWVLQSAAQGGAQAGKALVEVVPRGYSGATPVYEATVYRVVPTSFNPGEKNTSDGQEYGISFQTFGGPIAATPTASAVAGTAFTIVNPS